MRDGAVGDELAERLLHAEVASAHTEIVVREKHLRGGELVGVEGRLPHLHEARLADGGAGLLLGDLLGLAGETEGAHAEADGAGGDHDHLGAARAQGGELGGDGLDAGRIQLADTGGEHAGAELDDDAAGRAGRGGEGHLLEGDLS